MNQAVVRCLRRRLGLVGPDEVATRLLGGLVSCLVVLFLSTMFYYAVIGRFFGRAARRGALDNGVGEALFDPTIVFGLALFFMVALPFCAWYEGVDNPDKADRMQNQGCLAVATVYLGGSIFKAMRVFVPRSSPLTPAQFQLATALLAHLLGQSEAVGAEALAQGILSGNPGLTREDFDRVMATLRERDLVTGDPVKLDSRFKAEIRHAEG